MTTNPTGFTDNDLAERLAALTQPAATPTTLWKGAIPALQARGLRSVLRNLPHRWLALAASLVLVAALAALTLPNVGKARSVSSSRLSVTPSTMAQGVNQGLSAGFPDSLPDYAGAEFELPSSAEPEPVLGYPSRTGRVPAALPPRPGALPTDQDARQVIRKATVELTTPDVRAAMLKAGLILNLAAGEFTEQSSLTGEGPTAQATLTLRVAADRLSEALNQLRALGKVTSEQLTGDDVTAQAIDLDARLRNEQRVESELLTLLDTRKDAPLEDILKVRTELSTIRENIERLTAQRDRLAHLVSLATILVIIRADAAPAPAGIWPHFKSSIASSWRTGLSALADTVAFLVQVAVGGLLWWLLVLVALITAIHYHRRARTSAAAEPIPTE